MAPRLIGRALSLALIASVIYALHLFFAAPRHNVASHHPLGSLRPKSPSVTPRETMARPDRPPSPVRADYFDIDGGLDIDERGLLTFDASKHSKHPVELLIERGKRHAEAVAERMASVTSVGDAVADYERVYSMQPPKGFAKWFEFAKKHKSVRAPSLYPLAHKPFLKYLSVPPSTLRERLEQQAAQEPMFSLTFVPDGQGDMGTACEEDGEWTKFDWETRGRGRVQVGGPHGWSWRCNNTLGLILPILPKLPNEFFTMKPPLMMVFSTDDGPRAFAHHALENRAEQLGQAGKLWPEAQFKAAEEAQRWTTGWHWTCPLDSPLKKATVDKILNAGDAIFPTGRTYVGDFYRNIDICYNPDVRELHSAGLKDEERFAAQPFAPYVSVCRTTRNSDIVGVPLDAVYWDVDIVPWEEKEAKIFWRGSPTGISHQKKYPWRQSQRQRLHYFANNATDGTASVLVNQGGGLVEKNIPVRAMRDKWFDIGLSGGPVQCSEEDGSCAELLAEFDWKPIVRGAASLKAKYAIDVDGNAWSSRFRRLLSSNNVVLKSTLYPEWFNELLIPWYHYVPIKFDYSDVYDIMTYFDGAPDGSTPSHDHVAREISENAIKFIKEHWRVPDMQSYMFLVMLEFFRLMSEDRAAATHK